MSVHCLGGNGRTGTLLACFLIHECGYQASKAIEEVRKTRPKGMERPSQERFVVDFHNLLHPDAQEPYYGNGDPFVKEKSTHRASSSNNRRTS